MSSLKNHTIDSLSKSFAFRKNKLKNDNKLKFSILIEKLSLTLIRKYNTVFLEKQYTKENLGNDIKILTKDIEFDNFLFDRLVLEIERIILMKIIKGREIVIDDNLAIIKNSKPYNRSVNKSVDIMKSSKTLESEYKNEEEIDHTKTLIMNLSKQIVSSSDKNISISI